MSRQSITERNSRRKKTAIQEISEEFESQDTSRLIRDIQSETLKPHQTRQQNFFSPKASSKKNDNLTQNQAEIDVGTQKPNTKDLFEDKTENDVSQNDNEMQQLFESIEIEGKDDNKSENKSSIKASDMQQTPRQTLSTRLTVVVIKSKNVDQSTADDQLVRSSFTGGFRASELTQESSCPHKLLPRGEEPKTTMDNNAIFDESLTKSVELGDSAVNNAVIHQQEEIKVDDNFDSDVKFDEDNFIRFRSDSIRSQEDFSKNTSQVFQVSDLDKILGETPSPGLKPKRLSRFHPVEKDKEEEENLVRRFRWSQCEKGTVANSPLSRRNPSSYLQENKPMSPSKSWRKVSLVVRSVIYMRHERVRSIETPDEMFFEMENYKHVKLRNLHAEGTSKDFANDNFVQDALEAIRRTEILCECATVGSEKHIKLMYKILQEDPRRNILSRSDANHIINKHSKSGQNALYFAAKFGNLNAVRFLLEQQADPHIKSYISKDSKETESCLHAAARWDHLEIVALLLQHADYSKEDLKLAIKQASRKDIKKILAEAYRNKFGGLGCLFRFFYL